VITDEATVSGTDDDGDPVSDFDTADVTILRATGTLKIVKNVKPDDPTTRWVFTVEGPTALTETIVGDGMTQVIGIFSGAYTITESAGENTSLKDYNTSWECLAAAPPSIVANTGSVLSGTGVVIELTVAPGDAWTCTFTNVRKTGTIELVKVWDGTPGETTLMIGTTPGGDEVASADANGEEATTGAFEVFTGTYYVSETDPGPSYETNLSCENQAGSVVVGTDNSVDVSWDAEIVCTFTNVHISKATRTQGFWSTHLDVSTGTWEALAGEDGMPLCGDGNPVGVPQMLGGFWANIARTSDREKRSDLDQARMQLLQQLLAAMLNHEAFGSSPGDGVLQEAREAFCGKNEDQIMEYQPMLDEFNNSGDDEPFPDGFEPGRADPKGARDIADIAFWDELPNGSPAP
jgi:hypothetical protein